VDHVLAYTRLTRDLLQANGVGTGKTGVSSYGIDVSGVAAAREKRRPSRTLRVGFVGTLAPHKGPDLPIRAFRAAPDLDATLAIYGSAEGYEYYMEELRLLAGGDQRMEFRGTFAREDLGGVFAEIDVLAVPSRWYENAPGAIFESFAAGAPVVATDLGGMSEFVRHEENGLLFGLDDADSLARQLRRLVEEPGLLERLRNGIGPVKSVGEYADEVERIYESLVERRMRA
jgi:glycosyltransferase involved in cell wall biosynthesis